jgi:haloacetate dehalogenase
MSSSDLADLFPGFEPHWIDTSIGKMFTRSGGAGPALLLLHGYAETNVMWHRVAPELARHFTLILPDLPGYGWSVAPRASTDHEPYSKRAMAAVMIEVMEKLGHVRFHLAGHDRGGRVAYRLALDHPEAVRALIPIDIYPTAEVWRRMTAERAIGGYHWQFLAQPYPLPETLIGKDPVYYLEHTLKSWAGPRDLSPFSAEALAHYRALLKEARACMPSARIIAPAPASTASWTRRISPRRGKSPAPRSCSGGATIWAAAPPTRSMYGGPGAPTSTAPS